MADPCRKQGGAVRRVVRIAHGRSDPATGRDLEVVQVRAVADLDEFLGVSTPADAAESGAAGAGAGLPGSAGVAGECFAGCIGVVVRAVDSVVSAVETEGEGTACIVFNRFAGAVCLMRCARERWIRLSMDGPQNRVSTAGRKPLPVPVGIS